jgi:hypothetical protein
VWQPSPVLAVVVIGVVVLIGLVALALVPRMHFFDEQRPRRRVLVTGVVVIGVVFSVPAQWAFTRFTHAQLQHRADAVARDDSAALQAQQPNNVVAQLAAGNVTGLPHFEQLTRVADGITLQTPAKYLWQQWCVEATLHEDGTVTTRTHHQRC